MAKKVSKTKEPVNATKSAVSEKKTAKNTTQPIDLLEFVKDLYFRGNTIEQVLQKYHLDIRAEQIQIGVNIVITYSFFGGHKVTFRDSMADVYGKPIYNNEILIKRVKKLCNTGINEISFIDIVKLGIFIPANELRISENLSLKASKNQSYNIFLCDANKDIDGKWVDDCVDAEKIKKAICDFNYNARRLKLGEVDLNLELENYLKEHFTTVKKSASSDKGDIDVLVGSGSKAVAIELKLARSLKNAGESERAVGQIRKYAKKFGSNLLVVIAGTRAEQQHVYVKDVINEVREINARWILLEPD